MGRVDMDRLVAALADMGTLVTLEISADLEDSAVLAASAVAGAAIPEPDMRRITIFGQQGIMCGTDIIRKQGPFSTIWKRVRVTPDGIIIAPLPMRGWAIRWQGLNMREKHRALSRVTGNTVTWYISLKMAVRGIGSGSILTDSLIAGAMGCA